MLIAIATGGAGAGGARLAEKVRGVSPTAAPGSTSYSALTISIPAPAGSTRFEVREKRLPTVNPVPPTGFVVTAKNSAGPPSSVSKSLPWSTEVIERSLPSCVNPKLNP